MLFITNLSSFIYFLRQYTSGAQKLFKIPFRYFRAAKSKIGIIWYGGAHNKVRGLKKIYQECGVNFIRHQIELYLLEAKHELVIHSYTLLCTTFVNCLSTFQNSHPSPFIQTPAYKVSEILSISFYLDSPFIRHFRLPLYQTFWHLRQKLGKILLSKDIS